MNYSGCKKKHSGLTGFTILSFVWGEHKKSQKTSVIPLWTWTSQILSTSVNLCTALFSYIFVLSCSFLALKYMPWIIIIIKTDDKMSHANVTLSLSHISTEDSLKYIQLNRYYLSARPFRWIWRIKNQLDDTCYFIVLLIGSTCFGHYHAHHQELTALMLITTLVVSFLVCCMLEVRRG